MITLEAKYWLHYLFNADILRMGKIVRQNSEQTEIFVVI